MMHNLLAHKQQNRDYWDGTNCENMITEFMEPDKHARIGVAIEYRDNPRGFQIQIAKNWYEKVVKSIVRDI